MKQIFSMVLAACALAGSAVGQRPEDFTAQLEATLEGVRREHAIPALGVGVIDDGEIVFMRTLGAPKHARFRAASISKLLTAQAVMRLVEEGQVALDDDVSLYAPVFAGRGITLRHLLTHTSGLSDGPRPSDNTSPASVAGYVEALASESSVSIPGDAWRYTDSEFNLLGAVIARVSGRTYPDYVEETLLQPIGADGARLFPSDRGGVLDPHLNYGLAFPAPSRPYDIAFAASEGLVTDTEALTLWLRATLVQDPRLLQPLTYALMVEPQHGQHAALGWQVTEQNGRRIAQHGGSFTGWSALVLSYPDERRGFVILTNADDAPRWEIAAAVDAVLDGRQPPPLSVPWGRRAMLLGVLAALAAIGIITIWRVMSGRRRPQRL